VARPPRLGRVQEFRNYLPQSVSGCPSPCRPRCSATSCRQSPADSVLHAGLTPWQGLPAGPIPSQPSAVERQAGLNPVAARWAFPPGPILASVTHSGVSVCRSNPLPPTQEGLDPGGSRRQHCLCQVTWVLMGKLRCFSNMGSATGTGVRGQPWANSFRDPISKKTKPQDRAGRVGQEVDDLPSKCEALSSNPSTKKEDFSGKMSQGW
jgi:hypothetical protein